VAVRVIHVRQSVCVFVSPLAPSTLCIARYIYIYIFFLSRPLAVPGACTVYLYLCHRNSSLHIRATRGRVQLMCPYPTAFVIGTPILLVTTCNRYRDTTFTRVRLSPFKAQGIGARAIAIRERVLQLQYCSKSDLILLPTRSPLFTRSTSGAPLRRCITELPL
jgi:hypothetical protein